MWCWSTLRACAAVLTPNLNEFGRLVQAHIAGVSAVGTQWTEEAQLVQLCRVLDGPVIVRKGPTDLISDGATLLVNGEKGAPKRAGGQGDVLAGCLGTLLGWSRTAPVPPEAASMLAAWTACMLTRRFSAAAFAQHGRAMTASDMLRAIGPLFEGFSNCATGSRAGCM